jgi:hypothetical protein
LFAVGADIERSLRIDIKKIQYRAINHQCETVSMLGKLFNHALIRTYNVSPWKSRLLRALPTSNVHGRGPQLIYPKNDSSSAVAPFTNPYRKLTKQFMLKDVPFSRVRYIQQTSKI